MSTLTMVREQLWSSSFWSTTSNCEFICRDGLADVCALPYDTRKIWAVTSKIRPRHDHWFMLQDQKYSAVDWWDDHHHKELDNDFSMWLHREYNRGYGYVTIYYEEIL